MRLINILLKANPIGIIISLISAIATAASPKIREEDIQEYNYTRERKKKIDVQTDMDGGTSYEILDK